jgi:3-oxoacyl-[acyl-carrier-protein] synthase II
MTRIAITGIGVLAPGAIGIDAFRSMLAAGRTAISEVDRFDTAGLRAHQAALVRNFTPRDFIAPMKLRRMNALSRYAVSAARLAFDDRGATPADPDATGVAVGTAFGPVQTSVDYMRDYVEKGAALAPPHLFAESVANAPGSHIAIEWGLRAFNSTITQRESSALAAAMYASSQLLKGSARAAIIAGIEEANEMIFSVLDRLGALAHASSETDEACRPFDRRRNGMVLGEGACMLVAEPYELIAGTPARVYGYLAGFGIARDKTATVSDWGSDPSALVAAMRAALEDAELTVDDIDAIYASANSTRRADGIEARAIGEMFGERVPVVATKGYFGEYAAAGGLHLAAALLAIQEQSLHASCGFEEPDEQTTIGIVRERRPAALRNVMVNSMSAGGGIVCAVVSREAA